MGSTLFLSGRGRLVCSRLVFGLGRFVHSFNLGVSAQLGDQLGLSFPGHKVFDLRLHVLEFRGLFIAFVFDFDDVPAELRF